ncbi:low molecular weight protein-tyrosine-phosphatase [Nocardioides alcanivorans]|uniref:low molecular weight protein-tyrosine-phosphatase n=1 Tax=Nocardioides alcanivorans TaxID=2897352 RepID=UPI001F1A8A5B|nr:low molecular weight protein-tyrosine-phosphatase [Nocardioides alcanivorans]
MTDRAPFPGAAGHYRIAVVCLGNICRSPMADVVLNARVAAAGLDDVVEVESFGTAGWHVGKTMDARAAATLTGAGYDATRHRARQFTRQTNGFDLVLAMDADNRADLAELGVAGDRLLLFRSFDPAPDDESVPDPYYGADEGFTQVLDIVSRCSNALIAQLSDVLDSREGATR